MEGTAGAAPAGWYDDPTQPGELWRYWDGAAWTEHTGPKQQQPASGTDAPPTPWSFSSPSSSSNGPLANVPKRRRKAIEAALTEGEDVRGAWRTLKGLGEALVCTDKRVIVIKNDATSGSRQISSYPYSQIASVHVIGGSSRANPFGQQTTELQLSVSGVQAQTSTSFSLTNTDRLFAPNTVLFGATKAQRAAAAEAVALIQTLIEDARAAKAATAASEKVCPQCAETIKGAAVICRFCGHHV